MEVYLTAHPGSTGRVSTEPTAVNLCATCGVERIGPGIGSMPGERLPCANDGCGSIAIRIEVTVLSEMGLRDP